jgi:hypothetical protein
MAFIIAFIQMYRKYLMRAAIVWAAFVMLLLVAYLIMLRPQIKSTRNLQNKLAEKKQLYQSAQKAADEQTKIKLNEEIESLRDKLKAFVIDQEDSANLTFDIGQIASREKVSSFSIKSKKNRRVSAVPDSNSISENHIDISFSAGFNQFATFVNALERHRPVLFVNEFSITRSNKDDAAYQVTLDVAAFVKKQQDKEVADQSSVPAIGKKI